MAPAARENIRPLAMALSLFMMAILAVSAATTTPVDPPPKSNAYNRRVLAAGGSARPDAPLPSGSGVSVPSGTEHTPVLSSPKIFFDKSGRQVPAAASSSVSKESAKNKHFESEAPVAHPDTLDKNGNATVEPAGLKNATGGGTANGTSGAGVPPAGNGTANSSAAPAALPAGSAGGTSTGNGAASSGAASGGSGDKTVKYVTIGQYGKISESTELPLPPPDAGAPAPAPAASAAPPPATNSAKG